MIGLSLLPIISTTINDISSNVSSSINQTNPTWGKTLIDFIPILFAGAILLIAISVIYQAWNLKGKSDNDEESEEEDNKETEEEDKKKEHCTIITTTKKYGQVKVNVPLGQGYNVDKYSLEPVTDSSLKVNEKAFNKTRFD